MATVCTSNFENEMNREKLRQEKARTAREEAQAKRAKWQTIETVVGITVLVLGVVAKLREN